MPNTARKAEPQDALPMLRSALTSTPANWALFIDIDGTLVDIAAEPHAVQVEKDLPKHLLALADRLGGALALVTGRRVDWVDANFGPHLFPAAGLHGVERRRARGDLDRAEILPGLTAVRNDLARRSARLPGVVLEDKGAAIALHFRQAPELEGLVIDMMNMARAVMGDGWVLQHGKMVIELRPANADKGSALKAFLAEEPFRGRRPIAIGDDVTDEAMFRVVNGLDGLSIRVCETPAPTLATATLSSPHALRALIADLAA